MTTPTTTAKRPSRATTAAAKLAAAPKPEPTATVVGGPSSTTGDNGHGFKRATASKPGATTRKPSAAKPEAAAKPVKVTAAKKDTGPTKTQQNRVIATALAKAAADMLAKWNEKTTGIPQAQAAASVASWLNYAPIPADGWDPRLPERSGAGGRGAKNRQASA